MRYPDRDVCAKLGIGINGLRKIRLILRQINYLEDREQISDEKLPFIQKIIEKQQQSGGTYENAINQVLEEQRKKALSTIFQDNDQTFALDVLRQALDKHYPNGEEILDNLLNNFTEIVDVLRKIGDNNSAVIMINLQESIINNFAFKFLHQQGRIND